MQHTAPLESVQCRQMLLIVKCAGTFGTGGGAAGGDDGGCDGGSDGALGGGEGGRDGSEGGTDGGSDGGNGGGLGQGTNLGPQSVQSYPHSQMVYSEPLPPSSHVLSFV